MTPRNQTQETARAPQWPRAAVSAAIFKDGKVLLGQRSKPPLTGIWSLPGGSIKPGETAQSAVERELSEETSVQASLIGIADVKDVILYGKGDELMAHYVITVFYGHWQAGEPQPGSDCMAAEWVEITALRDRPLTEGTAEIIERASGLLEHLPQGENQIPPAR